jgi:pimeloyl-ACP methyl ester carboxylesterase
MNDLKFALRQLLKNPGFTAIAVRTLMLALGIATMDARAAETTNATGNRIELVDIGARKLQLLTRGEGSPTVVIEAGLGEPPIESGSWRAVLDAISRSNRVCLYNRAGLGKSDPPAKVPRTSRDLADDLNALLAKAGVPGPYLLVGHSWGGNHLRVFAGQHPEKVLGMVLVDSSHPDQDEKWLAALPAPAPDEPESVRKMRELFATRADPATNPERIDFRASEAQVRAAGGLGDKPLVILSHSSKFRYDPSLPEAVSLKFEEVAQHLQADLKRLSSNSTLMQSSHGGHYLHAEDPELAIQGIRQALEEINKLSKHPARP